MELTMGRIVFYTPSDPNDVTAVQAPAIVSRVKDGLACLTVFPPENGPYSVTGVAEAQSGASEPGTWCWPQAAPAGSAPETGGTDTPDPAPPVGGGNEGSTEGGSDTGTGQAPGNGEGQEGSTTDPESAGPDAGGGPTTSEASEKPLYAIAGVEVPGDFSPSGLETPEGGTLYHYAGDTAGQAHTFDLTGVEGITLYAEADDNSQPVKPAETATA